MKIKLEKIIARNFKSFKDNTISFGNITNIFGENGTGKTTINDCFTFGLFGKDSQGNADSNFSIKPLDKDGNAIHGLDHTVKVFLDVDGEKMELTRTYKEKWNKRRGEAEKTFTGHETIYEINDVPTKQKDYKAKIDSILSEDLFKLVTNPSYFPSLNWSKQREILMNVIGDIDNNTIINSNKDLEPIKNLLGEGINNFIESIKAKIKKLNEELKSIPYRIDECNNSIVKADFTELLKSKQEIENYIDKLESQIEDSSKANDFLLEKQQELFNIKSKYQNEKYAAERNSQEPKRELEKKLMKLERDRDYLAMQIENLNNQLKRNESVKKEYLAKREKLREEFKEEKSKELIFNENEFICPTCMRALEPNDIENKKIEMTENFNKNKAKKLTDINSRGKAINSELENIMTDIENNFNKLKGMEEEVTRLTEMVIADEKKLKNFTVNEVVIENESFYIESIKRLEDEISNFDKSDNYSIKTERSNKRIELAAINRQLAAEENNKRMLERIEELQEDELGIGSKIAFLEGQLFLGEEFVKTKVNLLESRINDKFKVVTFKLFETQVNGGIKETCEAMVNGVPYADVNTAGKINAGLDIINTLCDHYNVSAPIFIDNRESVNEIIPTDSQIINLVVSKDKELKVEVVE